MKTFNWFTPIVILALLNCCSTKSSGKNKNSIPSQNQSSNSELNDNKFDLIKCQKLEMENEFSGGPITLEVCKYDKIKIEKKGIPNYKGQYSYETKIFLKDVNGRYSLTTNSKIFNNQSSVLHNMINTAFKKEYDKSFKLNPSCFEGITFTPIGLNEIEISMNDKEFTFSTDFGLCSACLALDGAMISISLDSIQKFLK